MGIMGFDVKKSGVITAKPKTAVAFGIVAKNDYIKKGFTKKPIAGVVARIESGSDLQSRVTVTRLLAIGVFAFAAKKKKGGEKYLTIEGPDFVWTEEIKRGKSELNKAMKFVSQVNTNSKIANLKNDVVEEVETFQPVDVTSELVKLKSLLDSGAISQNEFDSLKSKLLN